MKSTPSVILPYALGRRLSGAAPGLVTLTLSLQPVHMNARAVQLFKELGARGKPTSIGQIPVVVRSVAESMLASLNTCHSVDEWTELYLSQYVASPPLPLYLQAFVLPDAQRTGSYRHTGRMDATEGARLTIACALSDHCV